MDINDLKKALEAIEYFNSSQKNKSLSNYIQVVKSEGVISDWINHLKRISPSLTGEELEQLKNNSDCLKRSLTRWDKVFKIKEVA